MVSIPDARILVMGKVGRKSEGRCMCDRDSVSGQASTACSGLHRLDSALLVMRSDLDSFLNCIRFDTEDGELIISEIERAHGNAPSRPSHDNAGYDLRKPAEFP
jgi:hypothetical protein